MKWISFAILCSSLISCVSKPPDVPVFENLTQHLGTDSVSGHLILKPSPTCMQKIGEVECGHGVYIMSGKEIFVGDSKANLFNGKSWTALKAESVLVPAVESYAPLQTYIINECKQDNCDQTVDAFRVKLDSLNGVEAVLKQP